MYILENIEKRIVQRIGFTALANESGYFHLYDKFLRCPEVNQNEALIMLVEYIVRDVFNKVIRKLLVLKNA